MYTHKNIRNDCFFLVLDMFLKFPVFSLLRFLNLTRSFLVMCGIFDIGGKDFRISYYQTIFPRGNWRSICEGNLGIISRYLWYFLLLIVILEFSTNDNSSPEVIEGIFGEEIWEGFLIICGIFFNDSGRDLRIFHQQKFFPRGNWRNI